MKVLNVQCLGHMGIGIALGFQTRHFFPGQECLAKSAIPGTLETWIFQGLIRRLDTAAPVFDFVEALNPKPQ